MAKPTPEQRTIINAVKWARRCADRDWDSSTKKAAESAGMVQFYRGRGSAYDYAAIYLNRKLPKNLRVKL